MHFQDFGICILNYILKTFFRSPNGPGLTLWPEFGSEAEYLSIGLEQKPGKDLKGKHFTFMTQTLPQLINERKEGKQSQSAMFQN